MKITNKTSNLIAVLLLLFMLIVAVLSMKGDSLTMDELAHIPAGYGYMHEKDYRLNPEHPPLLKDLAAIPLLFMNLNFDKEFGAWKNDVNGQWSMGWKFIFDSGNNTEKMIFWSRIPMILILLILGIYIFRWAKELFGSKPALFALFLFSFSPTFIAHGRYVTTDVGAVAAFFIATYYFIKWLTNVGSPTSNMKSRTSKYKSLILAGVAFGIAQLIKFSLFLLVPFFGLLLLIWIFIKWQDDKRNLFKLLTAYSLKFIVILVIGYLVIFPLYQYHVLNYPLEKQVSDTEHLLASHSVRPLANIITWMADKPILRAYGQYLLGLIMVFQRAAGGNTTFFLGEVSNVAWLQYFPVVYAIKTPLALHILTIIALLFFAWQIKKPFWKKIFTRIIKSIKSHFPEIAMIIFLIVYWTLSIKSNLNIGVRHVLPTFPFVYILISGQIKRIFDYIKKSDFLKEIRLLPYFLFAVLLIWYAFSSLSIFPYYLTHFNELIGGAKNGSIYVADSNLDWGQDLKRLAKWVDQQGIEKIKVDYFGGSDPKHHLGDKSERWHSGRDPKEAKESWLAISATFRQGGSYSWLDKYEPVTVIGNSIFVYYID